MGKIKVVNIDGSGDRMRDASIAICKLLERRKEEPITAILACASLVGVILAERFPPETHKRVLTLLARQVQYSIDYRTAWMNGQTKD